MRVKLFLLAAVSSFSLAGPSHAGFEFSQEPRAVSPAQEEPMPIVKPSPVDAMPLGDIVPVEPTYIKRRVVTPVPAPAGEPFDSQALLDATASGNYIGLMPETTKSVTSKALVINPYPLNEQASHHSDKPISIEQAMMEQGQTLRPVITPGRSQSIGMIERARKAHGQGDIQILRRDAVAPVESMALTPVPGGEPAPLPLMGAPKVSRAEAPINNAQAFQEIVGFGRELPLALALSQVVPPEYSYAFAQNVDTGATVSWEGGKPWNVVLNDMLEDAGLKATIKDGRVMVTSQNS